MILIKVLALTVIMLSPVSAQNFSIYLVRHAEKQAENPAAIQPDPSLTLCGKFRAKQLAEILTNIELKAVYSTHYKRTLETATPTAKDQQIAIKHYSPKNLKQLAWQLKQQQQSVLIVGHSNTTPLLTRLLSGQALAPFTEDDYKMLYQISFVNGEVVLTILNQPLSCKQ